MPIESDFPELAAGALDATESNAAHYLDHYDIGIKRAMAPRGHNEILGLKPEVAVSVP